MIKRHNEPLVNVHTLIVALRLGLGLAEEALALHLRVVQLRKGVAELFAADEELKALRHLGPRAVVFGQGREQRGVVHDERGPHDAVLDEVPAELVEEPRRGLRRGDLQVERGALFGEEQSRFFALERPRDFESARGFYAADVVDLLGFGVYFLSRFFGIFIRFLSGFYSIFAHFTHFYQIFIRFLPHFYKIITPFL